MTIALASDARRRQSGLGITSMVIAIASSLSSVLLLVVAGAVSFSSDVDGHEGTPISYVLGGWIFGNGVLSLIGIVFGIGGLFQKDRRKKLAVAGLVLNVVLPIGLMFILLVAMTLAPPPHEVARSTAVHARDTSASDAPAWKSPTARFFQLTTAAMASAVVFFLQRKRHDRKTRADEAGTTQPSGAVPCPRCGKSIPASAEFCRRCGLDLRRAS